MLIHRSNLTDRFVAGLKPTAGGQSIFRDLEQPGFFLMLGARCKTFMIQADLRADGLRRSVRMKVAEAGEVTTREARGRARALLGQIAAGTDPRPARQAVVVRPSGAPPTLQEAWERYRDSHMARKNRSPQSIKSYGDHIERLMAPWRDRPLSELGADPRLLADRHEAITRENGPAIANAAMRSFRAVYNHARKTCRSLPPENPVLGIDWNPDRRRDTAMGLADLPAWFEQLAAIQNPVRRDFHLLMLLSGSRPDALKKVRVEHINFSERTLRIPRPKGGEDRAFDIPLSRAMLEGIFRLRRLGRVVYPEASTTWLFPSEALTGHLQEHKESRAVLSHWGNDLRQSYRTIGQAAGVSEVDMHLLMNHTLPGVNAGYITRSKLMRDHLREQQEKISTIVLGAIVGRGRRPSDQLSRWINSTSREQLTALLTVDPDDARARCGSRSSTRRLEVQAARIAVQALSPSLLSPPSRRLKPTSE